VNALFDIAPAVITWHADGREAVLARVVSVTGLSSSWRGQAVALVSDHQLAGAVLASVAVPQLLPVMTRALTTLGAARRPADHPAQDPLPPSLAPSAVVVDVTVSDEQAKDAGLTCGGTARFLVQDTEDIAAPAWQALADREPVCLVSDLDGPRVGRSTWFTLNNGHRDPVGEDSTRHGAEVFELFGRGASTTAITTLPDGTQALAEALWPTPHLVVVGDGLIAAALQGIAAYLGWEVTVVEDVNPALAAVQSLTPADAVLVLSHDHAVGGPVLQAGLAGRAGYVGALGSRPTQRARAQWLNGRQVPQSEIDRVRGPAGLDIGARTPQEIAVSIAAEVLAVRSGTSGQALRDRPGPVHIDGLRAPPTRHDDSREPPPR
jgi:xanthine dehydrogenase accessory factor